MANEAQAPGNAGTKLTETLKGGSGNIPATKNSKAAETPETKKDDVRKALLEAQYTQVGKLANWVG